MHRYFILKKRQQCGGCDGGGERSRRWGFRPAPSPRVDRREYEGLLSPAHPLAKWFWSIVREMSLPNRAKLLAFCTGLPSPPAIGFSRLPGFNGGVTQFALVGTTSSEEQLPSASTCFAKLKLPAYKSLDTLRRKLFQAIEFSEGFAEAAVAE